MLFILFFFTIVIYLSALPEGKTLLLQRCSSYRPYVTLKQSNLKNHFNLNQGLELFHHNCIITFCSWCPFYLFSPLRQLGH